MPGRPRLPRGTYGSVRVHARTYRLANGETSTLYRAICQFRDDDGVTRRVERSGTSKAKARQALTMAVRDRSTAHASTATAILPGTQLRAVAEVYFTRLDGKVRSGDRSPNTVRLYRSVWTNHLEPVAGAWTVREATVAACDRLLHGLRADHGADLVKTCRAVLSGVVGRAVTDGALAANPVRDVEAIPGGRRDPARALQPGEAVDLWEKLTALAQDGGCDRDLPDLVLWMLGTSDRIGNALAVHWPWVDLADATARLGPNVIRVKGEGLRLNRGTTKTREAEVDLPAPLLAALLVRQEAVGHLTGPVFPDAKGGLRDPSNTNHRLKDALAHELVGYGWVTSHVFRKTVATVLDDAGLSARHVADQLRHARPSMTQDRYMARRARNPRAVAALEAMLATRPARTVAPLRDR